jgi:hypothetical protein
MSIRVAVVLVAVISLHEHCPTASAGWGNVDWRLSSMRTPRFRNGRGDKHVTQLLRPVSASIHRRMSGVDRVVTGQMPSELG